MMKSSNVALTIFIAVSSALTVSSMPHSLKLSPSRRHASLARGRPLLSSQSVNSDHVNLIRRASGYPKPDEVLDDEDDDSGDCEESSDNEEQGGEHVNSVSETSYSSKTVGNPNNTHQPNPQISNRFVSLPKQHKDSETSKEKHQILKALSAVPIKSTAGSSQSSKYKPISHPEISPVNNPSSYAHQGDEDTENGYHGKATFYTQDGNPGACGRTHSDSDYVVAIQSSLYGAGKFCGKTVLVTRKSTGQSIKCVSDDACPGCPTAHSLDLSVAAFNALGKPDEGIFDIQWKVLD